jgi:hypothetical protein
MSKMPKFTPEDLAELEKITKNYNLDDAPKNPIPKRTKTELETNINENSVTNAHSSQQSKRTIKNDILQSQTNKIKNVVKPNSNWRNAKSDVIIRDKNHKKKTLDYFDDDFNPFEDIESDFGYEEFEQAMREADSIGSDIIPGRKVTEIFDEHDGLMSGIMGYNSQHEFIDL